MSYHTLLVHVEPTPESDMRLRAAVRLASDFDATLIGVGGCKPAYIDNPWIAETAGETIQALVDAESADLKEAKTRFHDLAVALGPAALWCSDRDYPDRVLAQRAAGADMIVSSAQGQSKASTAGAADLVMQAGIPVLVVPVDLPAIRTRTIVIAWKNTREARRAVSDALPLLKRAEHVTVLRICGAEQTHEESGLDSVAGRLLRQGVSASSETLTASTDDTTDVLTRFAEERLMDLIVAGAYGHSRVREWALGGVTHGLLERSPLPVLFSH
jgi:nucleotide-binding universal stress UspA family protein